MNKRERKAIEEMLSMVEDIIVYHDWIVGKFDPLLKRYHFGSTNKLFWEGQLRALRDIAGEFGINPIFTFEKKLEITRRLAKEQGMGNHAAFSYNGIIECLDEVEALLGLRNLFNEGITLK